VLNGEKKIEKTTNKIRRKEKKKERIKKREIRLNTENRREFLRAYET
jgi:hypothetical protein